MCEKEKPLLEQYDRASYRYSSGWVLHTRIHAFLVTDLLRHTSSYVFTHWLNKLNFFLIFVENCDPRLANCNLEEQGGTVVQYNVRWILERSTVLISTQYYPWILGVTLGPFLNLKRHLKWHNLWILAIRLVNSQFSNYQNRICSTNFIGGSGHKPCTIAILPQKVWLADGAILLTAILQAVRRRTLSLRPFFRRYAEEHYLYTRIDRDKCQ